MDEPATMMLRAMSAFRGDLDRQRGDNRPEYGVGAGDSDAGKHQHVIAGGESRAYVTDDEQAEYAEHQPLGLGAGDHEHQGQ